MSAAPRPGYKTTELTLSGILAAAVYQLAAGPCQSLGAGIARATGCLALAWIAGRYAESRGRAKLGG